MKITKSTLRKLIKEEFDSMQEPEEHANLVQDLTSAIHGSIVVQLGQAEDFGPLDKETKTQSVMRALELVKKAFLEPEKEHF